MSRGRGLLWSTDWELGGAAGSIQENAWQHDHFLRMWGGWIELRKEFCDRAEPDGVRDSFHQSGELAT